MQNVLLSGAVVLLTVVLWLRRKPVKPMLSSNDFSFYIIGPILHAV